MAMHGQDRRGFTRAYIRERLVQQLQARRPNLTDGDAENILGEFARRVFGTYLLTELTHKQVAELNRHLDNGACDEREVRQRGPDGEQAVDPLSSLWASQSEWSQRTFGTDQERGPEGPLRHIKLECDEALAKPTDLEEYADIFLITLDATRRAGFTLEQLLVAAMEKHEKCKLRSWPKAESDQPVMHLKPETP